MDSYFQDHLKYGWDDNKWRTNLSEIFWFEVGSPIHNCMSWRNECIRAADLIYQSTEKEILIHYSGGIDSEIVCRSFIEANRPFKVQITRFENGYNKHDIKYAVKFCKEHNIKYSFYDFDIVNFIETDCFHYRQVEFPNPFWNKNMQKHFLDVGNGFQIIGEGDIMLCHDLLNNKKQTNKNPFHLPGAPIRPYTWNPKRITDDDVYMIMYEALHDLSSHMEKNNIDGCISFFMYTPELVYSALTDSLIEDWFTYYFKTELPSNRLYPFEGEMITAKKFKEIGHIGGGNNTMRFKQNLKHKHWPEMEKRPKYTGMEFLQPLIRKYVDDMSIKHFFDSPCNNVVLTRYKDLMEKFNE